MSLKGNEISPPVTMYTDSISRIAPIASTISINIILKTLRLFDFFSSIFPPAIITSHRISGGDNVITLTKSDKAYINIYFPVVSEEIGFKVI
jgi:hypothetical protein